MNILIVILSRIPALRYGGTQRVLWALGKELTRQGHKVTFLARKGSYCDFADVIPFNPAIPITLQLPRGVDVVHFNDTVPEGFDSHPYIVTYHGNRPGERIDPNAVFVSRDHAARFGSTSFVYNGLDWESYGTVDLTSPRHDFHFLGKAAWSVKNLRGAIDIIKAVKGERLNVLGGTRLNLKMGFRLTLTPKARFRGMVGGEEKLRWLRNSKGLIFPVLWDEPFGLAITESLYCGAPVFGTLHGSLPELVTPEVGFLSNSRTELIEAVRDSHLSPLTCHEYAREYFSAEAMTSRCNGGGYLALYQKVLDGHTLNPTQPHPINPFTRYKMQP